MHPSLVDVEERPRLDVVVHVDLSAVHEDGVVLVHGEQRHGGVLQHDVGVAISFVSATCGWLMVVLALDNCLIIATCK